MFIKVIDANNEEIGCIDRKYLVPLGLRHQIGRVIVYSKQNQSILLQQRSFSKSTMPGAWDTSSSGHIDAHESALDGTVRELKEEIGIDTHDRTLAHVGNYDTYEELADGTLNRQTVLYALVIDSPDEVAFTVDPVELEKIDWIPIAGLDALSETITKGAQQAIDLFKVWLDSDEAKK